MQDVHDGVARERAEAANDCSLHGHIRLKDSPDADHTQPLSVHCRKDAGSAGPDPDSVHMSQSFLNLQYAG